jgi:hypothetical protein
MGEAVKQLAVTINRLCYCVTAGCGVAVYVEDYREQHLRGIGNAQEQVTYYAAQAREATQAAARHKRVAAVYKGKHTQLKKRVANGVCPCCHRSFVALRRHIETKHPEFKDQDI